MKQLSQFHRTIGLLLTILFLNCFYISNAQASLTYGSDVTIQNGVNNWTGGYLDVFMSGCDGNKNCVSTASNKDVGNFKTSYWRILSASGKPKGTLVLYGDDVYLQNKYLNYTGGYLDTREAGCERNLYCVSTASKRDLGGHRTSTWRIIDKDRNKKGKEVKVGEPLFLQNAYRDYKGGYLDTRGAGCEGNLYCVSTSKSHNYNSIGTTLWRIRIKKKRYTVGDTGPGGGVVFRIIDGPKEYVNGLWSGTDGLEAARNYITKSNWAEAVRAAEAYKWPNGQTDGHLPTAKYYHVIHGVRAVYRQLKHPPSFDSNRPSATEYWSSTTATEGDNPAAHRYLNSGGYGTWAFGYGLITDSYWARAVRRF